MNRPATFRTRPLIFCVLLCLLILCFWEGAARAESDNFFSFGLAGGGVTASGADLQSSPALGEVQFDPGYAIKTSLGFLLARKFHLEAEYLYTSNRIDSLVNPPTVTPLLASDRLTHSVMFNATYRREIPPMGDRYWVRRGFYFYIGGGAGISWQDYTVETVASVTDSSLAWQVFVGFERMNPSEHLFASFPSPFLQYRFLHITEGDFGAFQSDASMHIIEFGFRFYGGS